MIEKKCTECGASFELEETLSRWVRLCQPCSDKGRKASQERQRLEDEQKRWRYFQSICPPAYQQIERIKLPSPERLDAVLAWKFNPQGVLLHGPTGLGKSRCAWALLAREYMGGRSVAAIDSMAGLEYAAAYSRSAESVYEWVCELIKVKLLLMDDVFKNKLTDSFEGVIFTIIDQRAQFLRPTVVTCNDTGDTLTARMSEDRAQPMLRRLSEHCQSIPF
jgi:DNA replication protein DnaC